MTATVPNLNKNLILFALYQMLYYKHCKLSLLIPQKTSATKVVDAMFSVQNFKYTKALVKLN